MAYMPVGSDRPSITDFAVDERSFARTLTLRACLSIAALIVLIGAVTTWLCHGHLIYSLDDPYITLALGWHIGHGHYGLNALEAASPSSSILFPFLLAPFAFTDLQEWVPLLINASAAIGTVALWSHVVQRYRIIDGKQHLTRAVALLVVAGLAANLVGLVYTGLEHSLHTLVSVAIVCGLAQMLEKDRLPPWLPVVIVLSPLLRFEGMALAVLAIAVLMFRGQRRVGLGTGAVILLLLGTFFVGMHWLGLPLLPSSVLIKQSALSTQSAHPNDLSATLAAVTHHIAYTYKNPRAWTVTIIALIVVAHPFLRWRGFRGAGNSRLTLEGEVLLAGTVAISMLAHLVLGDLSGGFRYELYAIAAGLTAAMILWSRELAGILARWSWRSLALASTVILCWNVHYLWGTFHSPIASEGIYEQQYQMHRFATEFYGDSIAVNDLGWVSYRNSNYVLDVFGLGSEEARKARMVTHAPDWMGRLVQGHHVGLAMIFPIWFREDVPSYWIPVAVMESPRRTAAHQPVTFFATTPAAVPKIAAALKRFAPSLPATVTLTFAPGVDLSRIAGAAKQRAVGRQGATF